MTPTITDSPQSILSTLPVVVCASSTSTSHSQPPSPTTSSWRRRPSLPVLVPEQRRRGSAVSYNTSNSSTRRAPSLLAAAIDVARDAPPASLSGGVVAGGRSSQEEVNIEEEEGHERRQSVDGIDPDVKDKADTDLKHPSSSFSSPSTPPTPSPPPRRPHSHHLILLFILLWGVILSLDRLLTSSLQTLAVNSMSVHSDLAFLSILRSAIAALAGPPFAVLETLAGSRISWMLGLALYVAGHVVAATTKVGGSSSAALAQYALGVSLLELGCNGLLVLQQSLVARISSPRDRALFNLLPQASFVIWAFVSADVFAALDGRWRVGVGMFAVLGPVALLPLIGVLEVEGRRGRRKTAMQEEEEGANSKPAPQAIVTAKPPLLHRLCAAITSLIIKADLLGLLLISTATLGILLPIVIAGQGSSARASWSDARLLAPLLTSTLILLPLLLYWELKVAPNPLLPRQLLTSRTFLLGSCTQLFLFASVGALTTYLPTYLYVAKNTSSKAQQNVSSVFNFSYSLASLPFAVAVRYWRTAKPINVVGAALFTVGVGAMIWTSSSATPLFGTIAGLVVVGVGGAASVAIVPSVVQVDAQRRQQEVKDAKDPSSSSSSSTEDDHVIKAVAALNIANCLGSALGAALAGTLWSSLLRTRLTTALAAVSSSSASEVDDVYKQPLTWIASHAVGTGERSAVVLAYDGMWRILIIAATALAAVGVGSVVLMPNLRLGGGEEELDDEDADAKLDLETALDEESGRKGATALPRPVQKAWCRLRGAASR